LFPNANSIGISASSKQLFQGTNKPSLDSPEYDISSIFDTAVKPWVQCNVERATAAGKPGARLRPETFVDDVE
jgi:hypothetical protein